MKPDPSHFNRVRDCRYGKMLYNVHDMYIGRSFDLYGEFSEGEVELFRQVVRPKDIVLDIGANIGAHTIPLAQMVGPEGAVIAIEPQRLAFQTLCANAALNQLINVVAYPAAAGESTEIIHVPTLNPMRENNFGGVSVLGHAQGEPVTVLRLDNLPIPHCRLMKVDVESMELQVLKGAIKLIERLRPILYVENDRPEKSAELIRFIDLLGYDMFWHKPPLFNPKNFLKNSKNIFGQIVSMNMLCMSSGSYGNIGLPKVEIPTG